MFIARQLEIIDEKLIINNFFIENFVAYVLYVYIYKKNAKIFKNVYKFKKTRINVVLQNKKSKKKLRLQYRKNNNILKNLFEKT